MQDKIKSPAKQEKKKLSVENNTKRKISVIYKGYPGEDPFIQQIENATEEKTRRKSFLAEFLRSSPEGENSSDNMNSETQNGIQNQHDHAKLISSYFGDVETRLLEVFGNKERNTINVYKFFAGLLETGLRLKDPRLKEMVEGLRKVQDKHSGNEDRKLEIDYDTFLGIISHNLEIICKAFNHSFVIPDFIDFVGTIDEIYFKCKGITYGKPAQYIPQLSRMNPDFWAVSLCTVDGQRHSVGDVSQPFTLQSCSKPLAYALATAERGSGSVHSFIGMEPSGRYFNELCLDHNNKPHNPMINAGAILTSSLIKPELASGDRFDYVFNEFKRLCGGEYLGFNNGVFLSERENADRNFALAYFMRENKCFPAGAKISDVLDFYFQICSLEITSESGAVIAATLANGGVNPLTGEVVLSMDAVRNTLALMHSCGMYNYSGQFAFQVGLPAKSGVCGCILLVVPNTLGICLWSPNLDSNGNSCRGVQFCKELVTKFKFHHFDNLRGRICNKSDPRIGKNEGKAQSLFDLLFSVAAGDLSSVRRHTLGGTNLNAADYDGRTALHVAASEGHDHLVSFLLERCSVNPTPKDRWGRTPLDDAIHFKNNKCAECIRRYLRKTVKEDDTSSDESMRDQPISKAVVKKELNGIQDSSANIIPSTNIRQRKSPVGNSEIINKNIEILNKINISKDLDKKDDKPVPVILMDDGTPMANGVDSSSSEEGTQVENITIQKDKTVPIDVVTDTGALDS